MSSTTSTKPSHYHRRNRVLSRVINDITQCNVPLDDPPQVLRELYAVLTDRPEVDSLSFARQA
jgi:hypothetical protein